jgi:putative spermidine/putrescine transport system ATP-binding protein
MHSSSAAGKSLILDGITHRYGASLAVDRVTLDIKGGELVSLLGPSGCGKTTLLRIIAGFVAQTSGHVAVGGEAIDGLPPNRRSVGIVFQNYALFPHMTVADNVAFGLDARGVARAAQRDEVARTLALVKMEAFARRYPRELSGGQQQRVALARALAVRPSILLLDEPFAALDKNLRLGMQIEIKRLQRLSGITTILVTHDQEEALSMSDRVAVLSQGRLEQFAPPTEVYDRPETLFVNTFVGTANVLNGTLSLVDGDGAVVKLDSGPSLRTRKPSASVDQGGRVVICIRPEQLQVTDADDGIAGVVEMGMPLGSTVVHEIRIGDGQAVRIAEPQYGQARVLPAGTLVRLAPRATTAATIFPVH